MAARILLLYSIPEDVLQKIITMFDDIEQFIEIACISKIFYSIMNKIIIRELNIKRVPHYTTIFKNLNQLNKLTLFKFYYRDKISTLCYFLRNASNIKHLKLDGGNIEILNFIKSVETIEIKYGDVHSLKNQPYLRKISLINIYHMSITKIITPLLQHIDIPFNKNLDENNLLLLLQCKDLKSLNISFCYTLTSDVFDTFAHESKKIHKSFESLNISGCTLLNNIHLIPNVNIINLSFIEFTNETIIMFIKDSNIELLNCMGTLVENNDLWISKYNEWMDKNIIVYDDYNAHKTIMRYYDTHYLLGTHTLKNGSRYRIAHTSYETEGFMNDFNMLCLERVNPLHLHYWDGIIDWEYQEKSDLPIYINTLSQKMPRIDYMCNQLEKFYLDETGFNKLSPLYFLPLTSDEPEKIFIPERMKWSDPTRYMDINYMIIKYNNNTRLYFPYRMYSYDYVPHLDGRYMQAIFMDQSYDISKTNKSKMYPMFKNNVKVYRGQRVKYFIISKPPHKYILEKRIWCNESNNITNKVYDTMNPQYYDYKLRRLYARDLSEALNDNYLIDYIENNNLMPTFI